MSNAEFKILLKEVFNTHMFMNKRDKHTINELLYCLRNDARMKEFNFNIAVIKANGECYCIPTIDSFVDINTLSVWFDDDKVEYEMEEIFGFGDEQATVDYLTVYEIEEN